jgi:hypothetical protein
VFICPVVFSMYVVFCVRRFCVVFSMLYVFICPVVVSQVVCSLHYCSCMVFMYVFVNKESVCRDCMCAAWADKLGGHACMGHGHIQAS